MPALYRQITFDLSQLCHFRMYHFCPIPKMKSGEVTCRR